MELPPGVLSKQTTQSKEENDNSSNIINNNINKDNGIYAKPYSDEYTQPLQWFLTMLLYSIPIVNIFYIIFLLIKCDDDDRSNWVKGAVVMLAVSYIFYIITFIILKNISLAQLFDLYIKYSSSK